MPEGRSIPWAERRGGGSTAVRRKQRSCRGTSRMRVSGDGLPLTGDVMPRKPGHTTIESDPKLWPPSAATSIGFSIDLSDLDETPGAAALLLEPAGNVTK